MELEGSAALLYYSLLVHKRQDEKEGLLHTLAEVLLFCRGVLRSFRKKEQLKVKWMAASADKPDGETDSNDEETEASDDEWDDQ